MLIQVLSSARNVTTIEHNMKIGQSKVMISKREDNRSWPNNILTKKLSKINN